MLRYFIMKTAKISIEIGVFPDETGMINVWWWKDGAELNQEWKTKRPIWEFLDSEQTFMLTIGETIEITESKLKRNFELVQ